MGKLGRLIGEEAKQVGMPPDSVYLLDTAEEAVNILNQVIQQGDVILVKGSHGAHLDTIVAELGRG